MRTISSTALSLVTQQLGGEPLIVVAIYWNGVTPTYYCDRGAFHDIPELQGKILELSDLEDIINVAGSASSQSVSIKLDDTDETIKNIYNVTDIHKKPVKIYQWFSQINFNEKFILFEGLINSPIVWSETTRTLSFDIITKIEDAEIGYSPEEGDFPELPDSMLGKPWPLPFGTVLRIPALVVDVVSNAVLMDSIGLHDPALESQRFNLIAKAFFTNNLAVSLIIQGGFLQFEGDWLSQQDIQDGGLGTFNGKGENTDPAVQQGKQMVTAGNKLLAESLKMLQDASAITRKLEEQMEFERDTVVLFNGLSFPQNQTATFEIGGLLITGSITASSADGRGDSVLHIQSVESKTPVVTRATAGDYATYPQTGVTVQLSPPTFTTTGGGFVFVKAGTQIKWLGPLAIRWIAAMLPCTVLGVYAIRDYGGTKLVTALPTNYYTVSYEDFSNDSSGYVTATIITLERPLTYIEEAGWEDQIFVDLISPVGPNTVGILQWLIGTYTSFGWDADSFFTVSEQLANFPMNFCLFDRRNIVQALQEIAYQARCSIYLNDNKFYLTYLVPEPTPIDTIGLDDIIFGSLEIHHTPTESLVTKLVADYKIYYGPQTIASDLGSKQDKIILRHNMAKYGLHKQDYDYYAYTSPFLVDLSATFWLIRKANTWKLLKFKTPLHKLKLESFDAVTIDISWACNGTVTGIVESCHLNSETMEIEFQVWLPVRLGEMTKYNFAWPVDSTYYFFPEVTDQPGSGGKGENTADSTGALTSRQNGNGVTVSFPKGGRRRIHDGNPNPGATAPTAVYPIVGGTIGQLENRTPPTDLENKTYDLSTEVDAAMAQNQSFPAKIVSPLTLPKYRIEAFPAGRKNPSVITGAIDASYDPDLNPEPLKGGTWVMVSKMSWTAPEDKDEVPPKKFQKTAKYFVPPGTKSSSVFPGEVVSGTGNTYTVKIWRKGLTEESENVTVKQLYIVDDTVPAGTSTLVAMTTLANGDEEFTMQVPTWVA